MGPPNVLVIMFLHHQVHGYDLWAARVYGLKMFKFGVCGSLALPKTYISELIVQESLLLVPKDKKQIARVICFNLISINFCSPNDLPC